MRASKLVIILFCIFVAFSFLFCNPKKPEPTLEEIALYEITEEPRTFPIDILVTNEFSERDKKAIKKALEDWTKFSNGIIQYNITYDWVPTDTFSEYRWADSYPITVWKKQWDDPVMLDMLMKYSLIADGFSVGNLIVIIEIDDRSYRDMYIIFKHEFGHTLGMEHIKPQYPSLMNIGSNQGVLSRYDRIMFCSIYSCKD